ncbi:MAG: lytic murein transglycosylase [Ponticaulis sp.]|nr:lytic murein transglycosylase [Ponticaulis sp.]
MSTLFSVAVFVLASCQSTGQTPPPSQPPPVVTPPPVSTGVGSFRSSGHLKLDAWREEFAAKALADGHSVEIIRSVLEGIEPMSQFLEQKSAPVDQAEFSKPIWEYVDDTVSRSRLTNGRQRLASDANLFSALEAEYQIQREYLVAIWGMETSYGAVIGNFDAPSVLASMATEGRRQSFAERELLALMSILASGDAYRHELIAGWAGAMGQTQFMPTTYLAYAVDWTGDGTKDVWRARADALASAGNYLRASGWRWGEPSLVEVTLPDSFNFALANGEKHSTASWETLGIAPVTQPSIDPAGVGRSELWLPAGASGPAFLLYPNFNVIKTYNRADSYALSVSLIAEGVKGNPAPAGNWPRTIDRLNIEEIKRLQAGLNRLGYNAGPVDGIAGRGTRGALQAFQIDHGMLADGFPTRRALSAVEATG